MPHQHEHTDLDWAAMGPVLERQAEVFAPVHRQAIAWLSERQTKPRRIIDLGSGPGVITCLLAETFPGAEATAVDGEPALLARAEDRAARRGITAHVRTLRADLPGGLDGVEPAELVWASKSLHHIGDQRAALTAFGRLLTPGGTLALLEGGLPTRWLPRDIGFGRPGLQSRLDAAEEDGFARMRADLPDTESETENWPSLLTSAGLRFSGTRTFLLDLPAPLTDAVRDHVIATLVRRREALDHLLSAEDIATVDRLLDPADPASLHHRPDVFLLTAETVHTAVMDGHAS